MLQNILKKIFGDPDKKYITKITPLVAQINSLEDKISSLSKDEMQDKTREFKKELLAIKKTISDPKKLFQVQNDYLLQILPEAFALVREAAKRNLNQRPYDVQLMAGIALFQGKVVEMKTGEGKTLAATLSTYLESIRGEGVHIITVNDYLARRDTVWMGQIYHYLGLAVGCIDQQNKAYLYDPNYQSENSKLQISNNKQIQNSNVQNLKQEKKEEQDEKDKLRDQVASFKVLESYLRPVQRQQAYQADIVYGANKEFGFDFLRDNLVYEINKCVQRKLSYAIVDEVDSILIDEARSPLIISSPDVEAEKKYSQYKSLVLRLKKDVDYQVDEKMKAVFLTDQGIDRIEGMLGVKNIYEEQGAKEIYYLEEALKAQVLFERDKNYVVKDGQVVIVDEFTGRLMPGRRYSGGLHQAIEAKEGVKVQKESKTVASITFQNYFKMYQKISGMTGTAKTSEEEFYKVYGMEVVIIPTNKPMIRKDLPDKVYVSEQGKFKALIQKVKELNQKGQPVLIGTVSIERNEYLSQLLNRQGIRHQVLNAKNHEQEGNIIAQAGQERAVTVATNMAGRGVDIVLGGSPFKQSKADKVKSLGGLFVIGTERHEARRIDNQLRGRAGRQGDIGYSQFYISLDDELIRVFGAERMIRIKSLIKKMGVPEDQPIGANIVSNAIEKAQQQIEGFHFDVRKNVLEYDNVVNKHRQFINKFRRQFLEEENNKEMIETLIKDEVNGLVNLFCPENRESEWKLKEIIEKSKAVFLLEQKAEQEILALSEQGDLAAKRKAIIKSLFQAAKNSYLEKQKQVDEKNLKEIEKFIALQTIDFFWSEHLAAMEFLRDSVRLRAYGQRDPLVEYKREGHRLFQDLMLNIKSRIVQSLYRVKIVQKPRMRSLEIDKKDSITGSLLSKKRKKIGRNDPCPCGAKRADGRLKKYKHCCGKNL